MDNPLTIGNIRIHWLSGGGFAMDGGAMFGVVPKALWSKKYPSEDNYIRLVSSPLLLETPGGLIVIETGIGNKLSDKQKAIFQVWNAWDLPGSLASLGFSREDVGTVVLTHCDFDHAGGVVMTGAGGGQELTFPKARHLIQRTEWEDATNPNRRSSHTYWPQNVEALRDKDLLVLVDGEFRVEEGISVSKTGGHTRGHQVVEIHSQGEWAVHLGDLLPTHAHFNPLWVMAFDNFPLDAINEKERLERHYGDRNAWFLFYHDPFLKACRFDAAGNITEKWGEQG